MIVEHSDQLPRRLHSLFAMSETQKPADTTTPESSSTNAKTVVVEPTVPERPIRILGDYELVEELGQGAMGIVYRARQKSAGRFVAIKLIRQDLLHGLAAEKQKNAIERFRTEAKAAAQLEHEHIVTVYDVGEIDGQPFFSMRLVEGASMSDVLRDGPMENRRVAKLMEPLARAIHEAHTRGILHRDLKPQNIMIDKNKWVFVMDFGVARQVDLGTGTTLTVPAPG